MFIHNPLKLQYFNCAKSLFSLPPDERKKVQRRTFTRWMNVFLQRIRHKSIQFYCNTVLIYFSSEMQSPIRTTICYFQRDAPVEVRHLFTYIQDGRILMALLEELSECKLVRITQYNWMSPRRGKYKHNTVKLFNWPLAHCSSVH